MSPEYRKNKGAFLFNGEVSNGSEQFGINGNNEKNGKRVR